MQTAQILLYEDIVNDPQLTRYVKKTLDAMGLHYKDDGSAKGWLKSDLIGGAPNGQPWDLVIIAIESRGEVSGEYFEYLMDVLNKGSAVILEAWHLGDISKGAVAPILLKCGIEAYPYILENGFEDILMYPLEPTHPVLTQPNSGFSFTKGLETWFWTGSLGSKQAINGKGDAVLLIGTNGSDKFMDGTLSVCMGGQLTTQTFSSHTYSYERVGPLWENYIYNALTWRFSKK
jgi:hypothetical protein